MLPEIIDFGQCWVTLLGSDETDFPLNDDDVGV